MTSCIEEGLLKAYIDDALPELERTGVSMHLRGCEACQSQAKELEGLSAQVGALLAIPVTGLDADAALARLRNNQRGQHQTAIARQETAKVVAPRDKGSRPAPIWRIRPAMAGMGLAAVMVAVLGLLFILGNRQPVGSPAAPFVPPGKVRHLVITHTHTKPGEKDRVLTEDVWLTNGKSHLLMYSTFPTEGISTWVEEDAVYSHGVTSLDKRRVFKYPYHKNHLELYVPNEISYLLTLPHARIVGESTLDGRTVTVLDAKADRSNPSEWFYSDGSAVTDYKLWVDKETSQVLQRQHSTTFLSGNHNGTTLTQTFKVTANELKDASEVPADLFKFKLPAGAEVVEAPSPFAEVTPTVSAAQSGEFVPAGKVRHLVINDITESGYSNNSKPSTFQTRKWDIWYANGKSHLLMRSTISGEGLPGVGEPYTSTVLVDDSSVYVSQPGDSRTIYKYAYNPRYAAAWSTNPQIISDALKLPDSRIIGHEWINNTLAVKIESVWKNMNVYTSLDEVRRYQWIDEQSQRLIQEQHVNIYLHNPKSQAPDVTTNTVTLALDEIKDLGELPADFFEFKLPEGAILIETEPDPLAQSTSITGGGEPAPTPAPEGTSHAPEPDRTALPVGSIAPDFELEDVRTNQMVKLSSLRGRSVMLMFWGSWCPPCRDSMAQVKRAYDRWHGSVEFISLSSSPRDEPTKIRDFIEGEDYPWMFVHDPNRMAVLQYKASSVPVFYFVDPAGTIKDVHLGLPSAGALDTPLGKIAPINPPGVPADGIPGWYVFTSPHGAFSILMPRQLVDVGGRDGWDTFGVKNGDVTYMAVYHDYPGVTSADSPEKWLDQELASIVGDMSGTSRDVKPIQLNGYPGRDLAVVRTDGRFTRSRVYLVGTRVYNVYAIAANEKVAYSEEVERYLDSFKLLEP